MTEFSKRLKQKMDERRLSQSVLARRVGVTPTAVWNWENGNSIPRQRSISKLAQVLGVEVNWLMGDDSTDEPQESTIDSVGDELERLQEMIAELNGVDVERVTIRVEIA